MLQLVRSFTWTVVDSSASSQLDGHVYQAQTLLSLVLHHAELCTELYCQLIKQTSKHPPQQKSAGMQVSTGNAFLILVLFVSTRVSTHCLVHCQYCEYSTVITGIVCLK